MSTNHGPDANCQRTTGPCVGKPHRAGEHLDPRHPLYDGPDIALQALSGAPRRAAWALIQAGAPVPEVVDLVEEIHRLTRQVAAVRVDADRRERAAMNRALDCAEHGALIKELEEQVTHFDTSARRNDAGRVALLGLLHSVGETVRDAEARKRDGRPLPTGEGWLTALRTATKSASAAHERAWKR